MPFLDHSSPSVNLSLPHSVLLEGEVAVAHKVKNRAWAQGLLSYWRAPASQTFWSVPFSQTFWSVPFSSGFLGESASTGHPHGITSSTDRPNVSWTVRGIKRIRLFPSVIHGTAGISLMARSCQHSLPPGMMDHSSLSEEFVSGWVQFHCRFALDSDSKSNIQEN